MPTKEEIEAAELAKKNAGGDAGGDARDEKEESEKLTPEQQAEELAKTRKALKDANRESAQRRKRLEELEAEEAKRKQAALSESERLTTRLAEAEKAASLARAEAGTLRLRHAVELQAARMGFHNPDDAYALADLAGVELDPHSGQAKGVEEALEALKKSRPYLVKAASGAGQNTNAGNRGTSDALQIDEADIAARYGLKQPYNGGKHG